MQLFLKPGRSRHRQFMIAAIHLVAAISVSQLPLSLAALACMGLVIAVAGVVSVWRDGVQAMPSLDFAGDGSVAIAADDGRVQARLLPSSTDFGWAIWLHWREQTPADHRGRRRRRSGALMLMPDQCTAGEWRQFRIWLRHCSGVGLSADRAGL
ncbi:protein YgfX [Rhodocyclaceae bacterium SMB388]